MGKTIGIDLGTTNSCVAVMEGGEAVVIPNAEGGRTTASVVAFTKEGERLVGEIAKRQAITNPDRTISSIKRHMGTSHKEKIGDKEYSPPEVSAMILQKLKQDAEAYLGETVTEAVLTVPAYFTDSQRQATKDAGKIAGLDVKRIINEPTAAALSYGLEKDDNQTILVFDLGGGTFDVSILELGDGVFEVIATSGNNKLGGDDFDQRIIDWMVDAFKKSNNVDLSKDKVAVQRLKEAAEKAKHELSGVASTNINLPFVTATQEGPLHLDLTLTRAQFDNMTADLVEKTVGPTRRALKDASLEPKDIDKVILVGGSTRMPSVQESIFKIIGKEPYKGVNPDECVALGAAIQGGVLAGEVKDVLLLDVTPLSLGIETLGGIFTRVIERNTTIPASESKIFSTAGDRQTSVDILVLQGEREFAKDNKILGRFELTGIPPAPRGVPQIEVTFDIDANGIVHVTAKDKGTGKEQDITIRSSSGLSDSDIDQMVNDAKDFEEEDKKRREAIEARNEADSLIYQTDSTLKELGDKVDQEDIDKIEAAKQELKDIMDKDEEEVDTETIREKTETLSEAIYGATTKMYQQASAQQDNNDVGPDLDDNDVGPDMDDDVVDADFEVEE